MNRTKIEWCKNPDGTPGITWNPVMGCTPCSPGCANCYALALIRRFSGKPGWPADGKVTLFPERLKEPAKWRKPRTAFVCSMSDLFHEEIEPNQQMTVFRAMIDNPRHRFLVLTKRARRMKALAHVVDWTNPNSGQNIGLGVTVCNQKEADEKIPILLETSAAMRFISIEPMLEEIDIRAYLAQPVPFDPYNDQRIDWVILGGESGPNARPMHPDWVRSIRDQCVKAEVPFLFKQWGEYGASAMTLNGEKVFRAFNSQEQWINKARTWLCPGDVCLDRNGKVCRIGRDFMTAAYPVTVVSRVGKKLAGRKLHGKIWDQRPEWFFNGGWK